MYGQEMTIRKSIDLRQSVGNINTYVLGYGNGQVTVVDP